MTAKGLLLCAISLGIAVLVVSAEDTITIVPFPKEEYDKCVKDFNDQKRAMVKKLNIADGYELTWDPEIVKELNKMLLKEKDQNDNESGTYYLEGTWGELLEEYGIQLTEDGSESYSNSFSLLSPIHRTIGCVRFGPSTHDLGIACLLAPGVCPEYIDGNYANFFQGFKGVPGSNCTAGYANNDGLCSLIPPTTTTEKTLTKPPEKPSSEAKDKDSVGVTDVTSGSSSISILVAFLLLFVSFSY